MLLRGAALCKNQLPGPVYSVRFRSDVQGTILPFAPFRCSRRELSRETVIDRSQCPSSEPARLSTRGVHAEGWDRREGG